MFKDGFMSQLRMTLMQQSELLKAWEFMEQEDEIVPA
jgi:hypothetical protein